MHRHSLARLPLVAVLALATACGGAQTHAESPAPASSSASIASSDSTAGDVLFPESALGKIDETKGSSAPPAAKPESMSAAEEAVISGNALPELPSRAGAAKTAKPAKAKKPSKTTKKAAQASPG